MRHEKKISNQRKRDMLPPNSQTAELAVLSDILIDPHAIEKVTEFLEPNDFYGTAHKKIYQAAIDL